MRVLIFGDAIDFYGQYFGHCFYMKVYHNLRIFTKSVLFSEYNEFLDSKGIKFVFLYLDNVIFQPSKLTYSETMVISGASNIISFSIIWTIFDITFLFQQGSTVHPAVFRTVVP